MSERYTRPQRLRTADIAGLLVGGRALERPGFKVFVKANTLGKPRLGLIVPKRVFPRAVDRNRAKRTLREWFRRDQASLGGRDFLIRLTGRAFVVAEIRALLAKAL